MDTSSNLTSSIETHDGLVGWPKHTRIYVNLQTTHTVVDHRSDDGNVEWLRSYLRTIDNIVIEFLPTSSFSAGLVPGLTTGIGWPRASIWICLRLLCCFIVLVMGINKYFHVNTHVFGEISTRWVEFHHTTTSVVFAVPDNLL